MMTQSHRAIRHGNDIYREIVSPASGESLSVTYWDVWLAVVLVNEFGGDWEKLANHLRSEREKATVRGYAAEGFLYHLHMLRQTLTQAGLTIEDMLGEAGPQLLKSEKRRARHKILEKTPSHWEESPWMIRTPRVQCEERAWRGYWHRFPVSPEQYAEALERLYKPSGWYSEDQSFGLERKLSAFVERRENRASHNELFALYRAFLTVVVEKMDMADDSYGVIGDLYGTVFEAYAQLDRSAFDMQPADFFQDLIEFLIWEDYGFTYNEQPAFFASLTPAEVSLVEGILRAQWDELRALELDYQAEKALTMLGMLCTQQRMFDKFVDLAKVMGTRHWQRITTMSEMAESHQQYDLALAVYKACLGPGSHEKFLRKKYAELIERIQRVS